MASTWIADAADDRLPGLWPGAADFGDDLTFPFGVARIQCERFAPALDADADVPDNYIAGQIMQTRALVRAGLVGDNSGAGGMEDAVTLFPMDWTVKNVLRPKRGVPYMGRRA